MKKVLILILSLTITLGVFAQFRGHGGYYYAPHVTIVGGYPPYYPYYYNPFYAPYFGYPYYYPYYGYRPTKLDRKIEDIKNDYQEKIWAVKHDKGLTHKERRKKVRDLKHERDKAISDTRLNYYKH